MNFSRLLQWMALSAVFSSAVRAGDWPQILGPHRDGIAVDETLTETWPESGPKQVWTADVGDGFAGVAVRGDRLILFHRVDDQEVVQAHQAATGEKLWSTGFPCSYQSGFSSDAGPRCVPLIADDRVYVFGVEGQLRCLQLNDGAEVWSRDTWTDFGAPEGYFGAGSTPLLVSDRLIVNVGGRDNAAVVAFSAKDGKTLWQSFDDTASYSSPVLADIDGTQHVIVVTRLNTLSLDPTDGRVRFSFPFGARGPTVNGATPVVIGDHLFVSSSYRVGSVWATIGSETSEATSSGEKLLATQYATPIRSGRLLYAVDGRQDIGTAVLKCIDPAAQKILWEAGGFEYGSLVRVQDQILFLTCGGELIRFRADPGGYRELHRSRVLNATPRGHRLPAISNGRMFVRDDRQLKCLQIGDTTSR